MSISYTWKVTNYKFLNYDGKKVIVQVYWQKTGVDENNVPVTILGVTPFTSFNPDNFIEYEDVTDEIVLQWILEKNKILED